ncbi:hypothetical protein P154DRAFT_557415 [Amniculicola lignicola CBS 123094]|uniref:Uncharacterized protein n=1 Tax=Amniculicola lignicola CBS 123094 TaxID=1392246 RepID=A0A6A5VXI2_9PLEO|nr:hypothetical protein P154DRAFT_557415 [Amniculicola lignicola CBS 123094]
MAALQTPLEEATTVVTEARTAIIQSFWPMTLERLSKLPSSLDWEGYFDYYLDECHSALHDQGQHTVVRKHQDVIDIAHNLQNLESRTTVRQRLRSKFASDQENAFEQITDNSIDLAARLLTMVNIGGDDHFVLPPTALIWSSGSLQNFLHDHFSEPQVLSNTVIKMERMFNAYSMQRIAGIKIKWTSNLADHLRMVDADDKVVAIFHHASFLLHHPEKRPSDLFPLGFREETLCTLALLFPQYDTDTQRWFQNLPGCPRIDKMVTKCGPLRLDDRQVERFKFWHDRLIILKQAFDQSRPSTLSQWWCDRRNSMQWYTFWVAIVVLCLTIFFGFVQSIEGALQVYKAFHPS